MCVYSVCNYEELNYWLKELINKNGPRAIRYSRGSESELLSQLGCSGNLYDVYNNSTTCKKTACITYGTLVQDVLQAANNNDEVHVFKLCRVHPLPNGFVEEIAEYDKIVFAEEGVKNGGIGEHVGRALQDINYKGTYKHVAVDGSKLTHASTQELKCVFGLDCDSLKKIF